MDSDIPTSSGIILATTVVTSADPPTPTTLTTVSLRPEDVQAIVTGLASNPSALAAVALMMQTDQQPVPPKSLPMSSPNRTQPGKFFSPSLVTPPRLPPKTPHY